MTKEADYALYKGDTFIDLGTKRHLARRIGVAPATIHYMTTPAYRRKMGDYSNAYICIRIEDD